MNDRKMLQIALKNRDRISKIRVVNRGHKFYVTDPKKIKFWLNICKRSEIEAGDKLVPTVYISKLDLK